MKLFFSAFVLSDRDGVFTHMEADDPIAAITVDEGSWLRSVDFRISPKAAVLAG